MNFIEVVLMLFPAMIAARHYNEINKAEFRLRDYIIYTATFAVFINFIEISVIYLKGWKDFSFTYITGGLMVKYLGFGIILAYIVPYIYKLLRYLIGRYFTGSIRDENEMY